MGLRYTKFGTTEEKCLYIQKMSCLQFWPWIVEMQKPLSSVSKPYFFFFLNCGKKHIASLINKRKYQEMAVTRNNHFYAKFKILNCECPCYVWAFAKSSALKIEMQVSCSISHKQAKAHIKKTIYSFYKYNTCTTALSHTLHPEDPTQYAT